MNNLRRHNEPLVFFAGAWFAMALSLPTLFYWSRYEDSNFFFLLFVLIPSVLAFVTGEGLGSDILDRNKVTTARESIVKGAQVSFLTYLFFIPFGGLGLAVFRAMYERDPHEWLTVQFFENLFAALVYVSVNGFLVVLCVYSLLGALAGWLLYLFRRRRGN